MVDQNSNAILYQSAEVLYNQPVTAEYNEEAYVIEGLPETVDITLIGRSSDIYLAKQYPTHEVSVDLRELKPGSHKVTLKYKSYADYSAGGELEFKNNVNFWNVNANDSFKTTKDIKIIKLLRVMEITIQQIHM